MDVFVQLVRKINHMIRKNVETFASNAAREKHKYAKVETAG